MTTPYLDYLDFAATFDRDSRTINSLYTLSIHLMQESYVPEIIPFAPNTLTLCRSLPREATLLKQRGRIWLFYLYLYFLFV